MAYEAILYDVNEGVATITLNKPERLNAFDDKMLDEWSDAINAADRDRDVRVVIITGAGRGFCSGMNVAAEAGGSGVLRTEATVAVRRHSLRNRVHPIPRALIQMEKPYIAAINGAAAGAGMDMASMADVRFASSTARVGMTYVRMGLIPGDGGTYTLPRIVGTQKALDMIWTGKMITAQEMLDAGLRAGGVRAGRADAEGDGVRAADRARTGDGGAALEEARLPVREHRVRRAPGHGADGDVHRAIHGRCAGGPAGVRGEARAAVQGALERGSRTED